MFIFDASEKKPPLRDKGHLLVIIRDTDNFKYPGIKLANGGSYEAEITERIWIKVYKILPIHDMCIAEFRYCVIFYFVIGMVALISWNGDYKQSLKEPLTN